MENINKIEQLKPKVYEVAQEMGKLALFRVMNLDYHPGAVEDEATGDKIYTVDNQQYPDQGDFAYDELGPAIDRAYPRQLNNIYEMSVEADDVVEPNPTDNPGVVYVKNGASVRASRVSAEQVDEYINSV